MKRLLKRDLVLEGWSESVINDLLRGEVNIPVEVGETPVRLYNLCKVTSINGSRLNYSADYEPTNMQLPKPKQVRIDISNKLFEMQNGIRKIGYLNSKKIEKLVYKAIEKSDILENKHYRFIIIYQRKDNFYSSIRFIKSNNNYTVLDVKHSNENNDKLSHFPNEFNRINLTLEEAATAIY